jgi:hypothetical protein
LRPVTASPVAAADAIESLLDRRAVPRRDRIAPAAAGDIVGRAAAWRLYAREYGYGAHRGAGRRHRRPVRAAFQRRARTLLDRRLRRANVGSVFIVRQPADVAKLRLLLVDLVARGRGLGARLVGNASVSRAGPVIGAWCCGRKRARRGWRIYEQAGFRRTRRQAHHSFRRDLVAETGRLTH